MVTKRPYLDGETAWPTPNPFDTIYPYLIGYSENSAARTLFPGELILIKPNAPLAKSASDAEKKAANPAPVKRVREVSPGKCEAKGR